MKEYDYAHPGAYFVTVCTHNRECLFGEMVQERSELTDFGILVKESWEWLLGQYLYIVPDSWIIMPNHFHAVISIRDCRGGSRTAPTKIKPLGELVGAFKTVSTKRINERRKTPGTPVWQRNYYEHVIRNEIDLQEIREYIHNNPLKWLEDKEHPTNI
ncbi:MAG TPA: transposase, partial [Thermodesulfobacteriota bacterium]|nr:transposase [Thermodesulfobacteriota bacterium]